MKPHQFSLSQETVVLLQQLLGFCYSWASSTYFLKKIRHNGQQNKWRSGESTQSGKARSSLVKARSSAFVSPDSLLVLSSLITCVKYSCIREYKKRERETISSFVKATLPVIKEFRKSFFKSIWWMLIQILFLITKLSKINLLKNFGNFDHCILTYFLEFYCGNTLEDIFA